ncbi:MAG: cation-transporting P-type ATPase, partial [Clostridia bacterium]|nr:cation-transporting P-type ATPase [Clostridia bacterium]
MMKEKWYAMPPEDVLARLGSDASAGLPGKAARAQLRAEGENEIFSLPRSSAFRHATYILSDVSVLLLILAAVIGALFNRSGVSLSAVVVLALSCAASVVVYVYARRTAERMAVCTMPRARVIRGGKLYAIDVRELVRGDVILLETGDIVPADARLLSADSLEVMEYTGKISGKAERERSVKDAAATYPVEGIRRISEQKN